MGGWASGGGGCVRASAVNFIALVSKLSRARMSFGASQRRCFGMRGSTCATEANGERCARPPWSRDASPALGLLHPLERNF